MAELVRGSITDRPWGRTFATLGLRGVTGQLTLVSEGKRFAVAFERGAVVAAMSPLASDAAVRVALTAHLISSSQVPEISRRQAATPDRDEIDVIAELARLGPEHVLRLRRRAIAQRAARTFSVNHGDFVVTDETDLMICDGCELDVRAVIYLGARANLSEQRLSGELDLLGAWFRLKPAHHDDLPQFGFTDLEQPIVERLRDGGTLEELESFAATFIDSRTVRAVVYALASYNACDIELVPPEPARTRTLGQASGTAVETQPMPRRTITPAPAPGGARTLTQPLPRALTPPAVPRTMSVAVAGATAGARSSTPTPSPPLGRATPAPSPPLGRATPAPSSPLGRATPAREPAPTPTRMGTPPLARPPATPLGPADESVDDTFEIPVIHEVTSAPSDHPDPALGSAAAPASRDSSSAGLRSPPGELPDVMPDRRDTPTGTERQPREQRSTPQGSDPLGRGRESSPFALEPRGRDTPPHGVDPRRPRRADGSDPALRRPADDESGLTVLRRRLASSRQPAQRQVARGDSPKSHEVKALIAQRLKLLEQGADHFQLLGIAQDASSDALRRAYFALARQLHPDRLAALGISDDGKHAQRLFAEINAGFAILSDHGRRTDYLHVLRSGGAAAMRAEQARAEQLARQILEAEEAFRRGELAIRRDQPQAAVPELERAVQLNPDEADYHALLAWARFAAAPDKHAVAVATRQALDKAIERSPKAVTARFYLGRVERMLGRDADAHRLFRAVLAASPGHSDAAAELRVLESRMTATKPKR